MTEARILLTTVSAKENAETLAGQLLEQQMAACVNIIGPMRSIYRWNGNIERADEYLLLIKTTAERAAATASVLKSLHPYDLPECVEIAVPSGSKEYLEWLASSVNED